MRVPYAARMVARLGETNWEPAVARAVCTLPIVTAVAAVVQHDASPRAILLGVGAALPWVLLAFGVFLPWWLAAAVEIGCTAGFMAVPAQYDVAPLLLVILVALFAAANTRVISLLTAGACAAMMVGLELTGRFEGSAIWVLALALGWVGGFALQLQDRAHVIREQSAAEVERSRISRELHDVVAHSLAVTMLNLTGARLALRRDPDEAEAALRQAEESGRQSMADIRRAIGVLGTDGLAAPLPGAADVTDLVRGFRDAGLQVTLRVDGEPGAVSAVTGLALYRVAEESLSNVVKHAPGAAATVTLEVDASSARLLVENRRTNGRVGEGLGIAGMRERAALVGGTLHAGASDDTWYVAAELPVGTP